MIVVVTEKRVDGEKEDAVVAVVVSNPVTEVVLVEVNVRVGVEVNVFVGIDVVEME